MVGSCTASSIASASRKSFLFTLEKSSHMPGRHEPGVVAHGFEPPTQLVGADAALHANQAGAAGWRAGERTRTPFTSSASTSVASLSCCRSSRAGNSKPSIGAVFVLWRGRGGRFAQPNGSRSDSLSSFRRYRGDLHPASVGALHHFEVTHPGFLRLATTTGASWRSNLRVHRFCEGLGALSA